MDWRLFSQLAMTFVVAIFGGWLGHLLSARRDLANERRKLRIQYLVEAYKRLEGSSDRVADQERYWPDLESAIADIQLLGTPRQVLLAKQFADDMGQKNVASTDSLIFDLRQSLRSELKIPPVSDRIILLRFTSKARPLS